MIARRLMLLTAAGVMAAGPVAAQEGTDVLS